MFLRLLLASLSRRRGPRALAALAVALGVAALTALLSLGLSVGDRVAAELRRHGANIRIEAAGEDLPLEIGGRDLRYLRPSAGLPEEGLEQLRRIFWRNDLVAFAPAGTAPLTCPPSPTRWARPSPAPGPSPSGR